MGMAAILMLFGAFAFFGFDTSSDDDDTSSASDKVSEPVKVEDTGDLLAESGDGGTGDEKTAEENLPQDLVDAASIGTDGDDSLAGTDENDVLLGEAGNDTLVGLGGIDILYGGAGDDVVLAGEADDELYGRDGDDTLRGNDGNDLIQGDAGTDLLQGGDGDDTLYGEAFGSVSEGADLLEGEAGNDLLDGSLGADTLIGGEGNDTLVGFQFNASEGFYGQDDLDTADTMSGGNGDDVIFLGEGDIAEGGSGADTFLLGLWHGGGAQAVITDFSADDVVVLLYDETAGPAPSVDVTSKDGDAVISYNGEILATVEGGSNMVTAANFAFVPVPYAA